MKLISSIAAIKNTAKLGELKYYPSYGDQRFTGSMVFPVHKPKFKIDFGNNSKIFTIGSCFARNIEVALKNTNSIVPTSLFSADRNEWNIHPSELLNEYTPGTIQQRIIESLEPKYNTPLDTIVEKRGLYYDLSFSGNNSGVSNSRALVRRAQRRVIYEELPQSNLVIITLGHTEGWFDEHTNYWLNQMPINKIKSNQYCIKQPNTTDVYSILKYPLDLLVSQKIKVVLTVSPIPMHTTFSGYDCILANEYSKSTLRSAAQLLADESQYIDYFPSYEMGRSIDCNGKEPDNIHIKQKYVDIILNYMMEVYC